MFDTSTSGNDGVSAVHPATVAPFIQLSNELNRVSTWDSGLLGKLLTFVDASYSDRDQREAVKSMIKSIVYEHFKDVNSVIDFRINQFTDAFEGITITYQTIDDGPNNPQKADVRANPIYSQPFSNNGTSGSGTTSGVKN